MFPSKSHENEQSKTKNIRNLLKRITRLTGKCLLNISSIWSNFQLNGKYILVGIRTASQTMNNRWMI